MEGGGREDAVVLLRCDSQCVLAALSSRRTSVFRLERQVLTKVVRGSGIRTCMPLGRTCDSGSPSSFSVRAHPLCPVLWACWGANAARAKVAECLLTNSRGAQKTDFSVRSDGSIAARR
eukprot:3236076-Rhodomonas_salina.2